MRLNNGLETIKTYYWNLRRKLLWPLFAAVFHLFSFIWSFEVICEMMELHVVVRYCMSSRLNSLSCWHLYYIPSTYSKYISFKNISKVWKIFPIMLVFTLPVYSIGTKIRYLYATFSIYYFCHQYLQAMWKMVELIYIKTWRPFKNYLSLSVHLIRPLCGRKCHKKYSNYNLL